MNRYLKLTALACLAVIALAACERSGPELSTAANDTALTVTEITGEFSYVINRDWHLAAVRLDSEIIEIDRNALAEFFGEIFTLRFDTERVGGVAAPNRYFGPYTLSDNQAVSMGNMANTLMAAIFEPEELKEHEFLAYLQNVYKWNLAGENLELHSVDEGETEAVLVFIPAPTNPNPGRW